MPMSPVGSKRCAVSSSTSRRQAAMSDSPGSRWPAGWLRTSLPSIFSCTRRNLPCRSMTAATVTEGFQIVATLAFGSGCLFRVLADEVGHALHARLDRLLRGGIGEAKVLPFAGNAHAEVDIGEHRNARLVQQALPELLGVCGADAPAGLGHVRPYIERPARNLAFHARDVVQEANDQISSCQKRIFHCSR